MGIVRHVGLALTCWVPMAACQNDAVSASEEESTGTTTGEVVEVEHIEGDYGAVCAFRLDGNPICWGGLPDELFVGDDEPASAGQLALAFEHVEVVGMGCGLLDGVVYCWGTDYGSGLLGYGLNEEEVEFWDAVERGGVEIGESVTMLDSAAESGTDGAWICAVTESGRVYCWGSGPSVGYPGFDRIGDDETPAEVGPIALSESAIAIDAGDIGTCAMLQNGELRCWGSWLLTGVDGSSEPATATTLDLGGAVQSISIGDSHACSLVDAGIVKCWGRDFYGEIGQPGVTVVSPEMAVVVDLPGPAVEVIARDHASCALLASGEVWCWGSGEFGKNGHPWDPACETADEAGSYFECSAHPSCCIGDDETPLSAGPVELPGPARDLAVASLTACALLETGSIHCWGAGYWGAFGDGHAPNCVDEVISYAPSCSIDSACCIGDDETPIDGPAVVLE